MKTILTLVLLSTLSLFATDATVTWTTIAMAKNCPGLFPYHDPLAPEIVKFASTKRTDTWHVAGTNEPPAQPGEIVWTPDDLSIESWTEVGSGTLVASNQFASSMEFLMMDILKYQGVCCVHTSYVCLVVKDIAVFSGGGAGLPAVTNTYTYELTISAARNHKDHPLIYTTHDIDDFNQREHLVFLASPGAEWGCNFGMKPRIRMTNGVPSKLEIRQGATNQQGGILINSTLSLTNWNFVTNFTHDANGDADIDLSGYSWSTNQGFIMVTNAP